MSPVTNCEYTSVSLDRRVERNVSHALRQSGRADLGQVRVDARNREVYLTGSVRTYYAKQLAQHLAMHVPGVQRVHNRTFVT